MENIEITKNQLYVAALDLNVEAYFEQHGQMKPEVVLECASGTTIKYRQKTAVATSKKTDVPLTKWGNSAQSVSISMFWPGMNDEQIKDLKENINKQVEDWKIDFENRQKLSKKPVHSIQTAILERLNDIDIERLKKCQAGFRLPVISNQYPTGLVRTFAAVMFLQWIERFLEGTEAQPISPKLEADKTALYYALRTLKDIGVLKCTFFELATLVKSNFKGMEKTKIESIQDQIKKAQRPVKNGYGWRIDNIADDLGR